MGLWLAPGAVEMPVVTAPMTGRTVGATTSFAVKNQTSGAGGKPVLPVFARAGLEHKKKKRKHHSEWFNRGKLKLIENEEKPPLGLANEPERRAEDPEEKSIRDWHQKHKLPWPGVKLPAGRRVIDIDSKIPQPLAAARKLRSLRTGPK